MLVGFAVQETLLVNYANWPAVGHMVEALAVARGYKQANPSVDVHLVVSRHTAVELAAACPWLTAVHTVDIRTGDSPVGPELLRHIRREWDYVVVEDRGGENAYSAYAALARAYFRPQIAFDAPGGGKIPFDRRPGLRLDLPDESRAVAAQLVPDSGTQIAVAPAGANSGGALLYPSIDSWSRILDALATRYPDLTVHLIGKLEAGSHPSTTAATRAEVDLLLDRHPFCRDRFDIGLFNQLAVTERCGVFVSPHTGLAFAALAVGTPWLTISGGRWPEFFHTGTPFYSVLPDPKRYPAFDPDTFDTLADDGSGRIVSMSDRRIAEDLPELLRAAEGLIERRWSFWHCYHRNERQWARLYGSRRDRLAAVARELAHPFTRYANLSIAGLARNRAEQRSYEWDCTSTKRTGRAPVWRRSARFFASRRLFSP